MATFLLKTEPAEYSWDDLVRDGGTVWEGVANNAALKHMRSARKGDEAFIYHTGDERRIVGLAVITSDAHPDPKASAADAKRLVVFSIRPEKPAPRPVTLAQLKAESRFAGFALIREPRLSVMAVPAELDPLIREMAGL